MRCSLTNKQYYNLNDKRVVRLFWLLIDALYLDRYKTDAVIGTVIIPKNIYPYNQQTQYKSQSHKHTSYKSILNQPIPVNLFTYYFTAYAIDQAKDNVPNAMSLSEFCKRTDIGLKRVTPNIFNKYYVANPISRALTNVRLTDYPWNYNLWLMAYYMAGYHRPEPTRFTIFWLLLKMTLIGTNNRVFDPCAGWGDRLLASIGTKQVSEYIGMDINKSLIPAYKHIRKAFGTSVKSTLIIRDSSIPIRGRLSNTLGTFDAVITSPPFFNGELYYAAYAPWSTFDEWARFFRDMLRNARTVLKPSGIAIIVINDPMIISTRSFNIAGKVNISKPIDAIILGTRIKVDIVTRNGNTYYQVSGHIGYAYEWFTLRQHVKFDIKGNDAWIFDIK